MRPGSLSEYEGPSLLKATSHSDPESAIWPFQNEKEGCHHQPSARSPCAILPAELLGQVQSVSFSTSEYGLPYVPHSDLPSDPPRLGSHIPIPYRMASAARWKTMRLPQDSII